MRLPHPPSNATRFFARVLSAILECPRCGTVWRFSEAKSGGCWDKRTSTFTCKVCGKVCVGGFLLWPVKPGGDRTKRPTIPRDQVPTERELAQLRARAGGWWMPDELRKGRHRPDDTNITAACICLPGRPHDANCPMHGGD